MDSFATKKENLMKKLICLLALLPGLAMAEKNWHGEGDLAYSKASGNTNNESLYSKLKLIYEYQRWTHTGQIEAQNSSEDDTRSAEAYGARLKSDFALDETYYVFAGGRYEDDRFSGYEYQARISSGLGAHIIDTDAAAFDLEGGVGYRRSEEQDTDEVHNEAVAIVSSKYYRTLTETTQFQSDFLSEIGQDNTYLELVLGIKVKINDHLALKVSYTAEHNTDVPDDTKNTDTYTAVGLTYSF
jgi:putative salt-induced outer membrane protein